MIEEQNNIGAGFIIFNKTDSSKVLVLIRDDGQYDIPKGKRDKGESDLDAAKRETFEECSIVVERFEMLSIDPSYIGSQLTTYSAVTDKLPEIIPNCHSGIWEHVGYEWVEKDKAIARCLPYLRQHIEAGYFLKAVCLL
jgi:8-oxo-dGTP pyrophosphatase MutT (NUDIX family)